MRTLTPALSHQLTWGGGGAAADLSTNGEQEISKPASEEAYRSRAEKIYKEYSTRLQTRFKWIPVGIFTEELAEALLSDASALIGILKRCGEWKYEHDTKIASLLKLIKHKHKKEKVLVFTQFADTARYLKTHLESSGVSKIEIVTGDHGNPTHLAWRFSPISNNKIDDVTPDKELRVLVCTDVLSEGQNLQDCAIVINYDLPWAIIRLIQRVGRVDRIGQESSSIRCYSFMPAEGVEKLINLRDRVRRRLRENAEVIGADEIFFGEDEEKVMLDLYNEKSGILDEDDQEVDLASYAWQIWKDATESDPSLKSTVEELPDMIFATKARPRDKQKPAGVLVYTRTSQNNDVLAWVDKDGNSVTQSQQEILMAAKCDPDTRALSRLENHHDLTERAVNAIAEAEKASGGSLGRATGARHKTYTRLKQYRAQIGNSRDLFITEAYVNRLDQVIEEIYQHPLHTFARDTLNRHIKSDIAHDKLADLVFRCQDDGRLCVASTEPETKSPRVICSLGLK